MIHFLHGKLVEALPTQVIVEVHGVGYEALIPLSSFDRLPPPGSDVRLLTLLVVREDSHTLYGFLTPAERDLFRLLLNTVSGIGPKLALNVLSHMSVPVFCAAVGAGDLKSLSGISGVGRKTAERIVIELRDKLGGLGGGPAGAAPSSGKAPAGSDIKVNDAVQALMVLGHKPADAQALIRGALALLGEDASVDQLVRASLKKGA